MFDKFFKKEKPIQGIQNGTGQIEFVPNGGTALERYKQNL